jgi:hypothetical protein
VWNGVYPNDPLALPHHTIFLQHSGGCFRRLRKFFWPFRAYLPREVRALYQTDLYEFRDSTMTLKMGDKFSGFVGFSLAWQIVVIHFHVKAQCA